ncbi:hypothetical protein OKN36_00160 [Furfurilactobacillus sp. OKN36]
MPALTVNFGWNNVTDVPDRNCDWGRFFITGVNREYKRREEYGRY